VPNRELIHELNSEQENLARTGVSIASDAATITVAGDTTPPAAPSGETATQIPLGIKVEWANSALNSDSTTCVDMRWAKIYYKSTTGVTTSNYDGTYVVAARQGTNSAFEDTVGVGVARYYIITCIDNSGNESAASGEVNSTGGGSGATTNVPDDATGLVFDDTIGTEGVVVGDGLLGVALQKPASTWSNFGYYRLWFSVDTGGGFGAWTEIDLTGRISYLHKGLTKTHDYRYKGTIVAGDGTESSTADKSKANDTGHTPNGSDNSAIIAELIFAENIVATNEVRGEHFFAQSYLAINDDTFGNDGIQLEYNGGNPRGYIGNGATGAAERFVKFDGTNLSWQGVNTSLTAAGAFAASSATISGALTATSGVIGGFTCDATEGLYSGVTGTRIQMKAGTGLWLGATAYAGAPFKVSPAGAVAASSGTIGGWTIGAATLTGGALTLNASGSVIGGVIATSSSNASAYMTSSGGYAHMFVIANASSGVTATMKSGEIDLLDKATANLRITLDAGATAAAVPTITLTGGTAVGSLLTGGAGHLIDLRYCDLEMATSTITGTIATANVPNLSANKITSDTLGTARIPNLSANKITSDAFNTARIPALAASKITSGTFDDDRIPATIAKAAAMKLDSTSSIELESGGSGNIILDSAGSVVFYSGDAGASALSFSDWESTGSVSTYANKGYITLSAGGATRYIRLFESVS